MRDHFGQKKATMVVVVKDRDTIIPITDNLMQGFSEGCDGL